MHPASAADERSSAPEGSGSPSGSIPAGIAEGEPSGQPKGLHRSRMLYYGLALLALSSIGASLLLNLSMLEGAHAIEERDHVWTERNALLFELTLSIVEASGPANSVFESGDGELEAARLAAAADRLERAFAATVEALQSAHGQENEAFAEPLERAGELCERMVRAAERTLSDYRAGRLEAAGEWMAENDRLHLAAIEQIHGISGQLSRLQHAESLEHEGILERFHRLALLLAFFLGAVMISIAFYGHRVAKRVLALYEKEREHSAALHLARLDAQANLARAEAYQREALDTSRRLGRAEVAVSVLHNVGNALNSIQVASHLIGEGLRPEVVDRMLAAVAKASDHASRSPDGAGSSPLAQLLRYLELALGSLRERQLGAATELTRLQAGIEQVEAVVAAQQEHGSPERSSERLDVGELLDTVETICRSSLDEHLVDFERESSVDAALSTDRHLLIQILSNLMSNAVRALEGTDPALRKIELRAEEVPLDEGPGIRFRVVDSGVGIEEANLSRIFAQGFT
ncbi:MAG: ATP-binding protein, partial [Myxococcales bacterium]|nr:ATP-binding protein [Myxococcales bacterium]